MKDSRYWFRRMSGDQIFGRVLDPGRGHHVPDELLRLAGIPERYHDCSLTLIPMGTKHRVRMLAWGRNICVNIDAGRGAIFHGDFGVGKTGSAVSLLIEAMHAGAYCWFTNVLTLNDLYKQQRDDNARRERERIERVQFLLLDDLGAAKDGDFGVHKELIERIIRQRYNERLATLITTNLAPTTFMNAFPTISSILGADYDQIPCAGFDWRRVEEDA